MADLTGITAVKPTANTITELVILGETRLVGEQVYKDAADSKHKGGISSGQLTAQARGILLTEGGDSDNAIMATAGRIVLVGATMTPGRPYIVSNNAGQISDETADANASKWVTRLGTAFSATELDLDIQITGIQS